MKKASLVFLSVLLLAAFFPRPAAAEVTFDLGIKGGVSLANTMELYDGEKFPTTSPLISPVFGGFVAINLNNVFTFQPEVHYLMNGGIWEEEFGGIAQKWKHTYRYIHVPLLAKFHLIPKGKAIPILFAGPAVDLLLSTNDKYWEDGVLIFDGAFEEPLKKMSLSAVLGGGVEFKMDTLLVVLEVRYNLGLNNIVKDPGEFNYSLKTKALMIMAGVGF